VGYGLVLGAGGVVGEAFHRGVLRALAERELDARTCDVVVGTSAGAMVAASIRRQSSPASIPAVSERARRVLRLNRAAALNLVRRPRQAVNSLILAPALASGRVSTTMISDSLTRRHGPGWPDAAMWIVAVRLGDGRRVTFGKPGEATTDVASAVAASCAIPGYFRPVRIDGHAYVDGAVHSPTNADLLATAELPLIVISSPMSIDLSAAMRPRWDLPLRLLFHRYVRAEAWTLNQRGTHVIAIEPDTEVLRHVGVNLLNASQAHDIEEHAYDLALRQLP